MGFKQSCAVIALASAASVALIACSEGIEQMTNDAGEMLLDAGEMLLDADATSDASAQDSDHASKNGSRIQIRRSVLNGSDGSRYVAPEVTLYDTELATECVMAKVSDGTRRCVPAIAMSRGGAGISSIFADDMCTQTIASFFQGSCPQAAPAYVGKQSEATCNTESSLTVFAMGAEYAGDIYLRYSNGACLPISKDPLTRYFHVGAEILPTQMVSFTP